MSLKQSSQAITTARNLGVIDGKKATELHNLTDEEKVFDALDASLTAYHEQHDSSPAKRKNLGDAIFTDSIMEEFDGWW